MKPSVDFVGYAAQAGKPIRPLPKATSSDVKKRAFEYGGNKHSSPLISDRPKEVITGLYSSDTILMEFQLELRNTLNAELPVDLDADLYTTTGVYGTFDSLTTCASLEQDPMSPVMVDNTSIRLGLGLAAGYTTRQKAIAREMWDLVFKEYDSTPLKVTKKSTWGARRFTTDHELKTLYGEWLFSENNLEKLLTLVEKKDWLGVFNDYEMAMMFYLGKRAQVDVATKKRPYFDIPYAVSNGKKGNSGFTNKRVSIAGRVWEDFAPMRVRTVQGAPWPVNVVNSLSGSGHLKSLFRRYPDVFHVCTPEQIEDACRGYEIYASDVSQYDTTMSKDAIDVAFDAMRELWDPRMVALTRRHMYSAYYTRPLTKDGTRGTFVGSLLSDEDQVAGGNRSGHNWTSLLAKVNKVIDELFVFDSMGLQVLGRVEDFLLGKCELKIINNGDDNLTLGNGSVFAAYVHERSKLSSGHYVVEREAGCIFSGHVLSRVGKGEYKCLPKLTTAFERMYVPERGIGGFMRPFWYIGWLERINSERMSDAHAHAWDIHNSLYTRLLAPTVMPLATVLTAAMEQGPFAYAGLTAIDKEVIEDPDKLHYKFLDTDVSQNVLETLTSKISADTCLPHVQRLYKGTIYEQN